VKQNITPYDALNAALQAHPEGISIQEVAELTGVHEATKNQKILQSLSNFMCNYSNEVSCKNTVHHNCTIEKKYIK